MALAFAAVGCGEAMPSEEIETTATTENAYEFCTVLKFDNPPAGQVSTYTESGITITTANGDPLYFDQGRLQNWQADGVFMSTIWFRATDNQLFTLYSMDIHNVVNSTMLFASMTDASSYGGPHPGALPIYPDLNNTTYHFPSGEGWDYIQSLTWNASGPTYNSSTSIDNLVLCHSPSTVYYGSDTNTTPEEAAVLPDGGGYYVGHLGRGDSVRTNGTNPGACWVVRENGAEYNTGTIINNNQNVACQFDVASAERVGPAMTHAYWWLWGPSDRAKLNKFGEVTNSAREAARQYGRQQAEAFIAQVNRYHTLIQGNTLFADIEGSSRWYPCTGGTCPATNIFNQDLLEAFLEVIHSYGYQPGLYTNNSTWWQYFADDFMPKYRQAPLAGQRLPFVLWIASCNAYCEYGTTPTNAALVRGSAFDAIIGGAKPVIWQFYGAPASCAGVGTGPAADFIMAEQNPAGGFVPRMAPLELGIATQFCSADDW
jgi:hypothetical protein